MSPITKAATDAEMIAAGYEVGADGKLRLRDGGPRGPGSLSTLPAAVVAGGSFALDTPATPQAVWGNGDQVLWAKDEALIINAPQGVGKTTLGQRLMLAQIGVTEPSVLGFAVAAAERVLYIAADRPAQAARSLARMVTPDDRDRLDERLVVRRGPPPFDLGVDPDAFASWILDMKVSSVIIDSLKDVAMSLHDSDVGSRVNHGLQVLTTAGVDVAALHHQRKASATNPKPRSLADVFGSTWITSGSGSVIGLWGEAGDPLVELRHLKQPAEEVGPLRILHDQVRGEMTVFEEADSLGILRKAPKGLTPTNLAAVLFGGEPTDAQIEKARRKLKRHVRDGDAHVIQGSRSAVG